MYSRLARWLEGGGPVALVYVRKGPHALKLREDKGLSRVCPGRADQRGVASRVSTSKGFR